MWCGLHWAVLRSSEVCPLFKLLLVGLLRQVQRCVRLNDWGIRHEQPVHYGPETSRYLLIDM